MQGFNEMKRRINPPLIIVYGDMIDGMTGRFVNIKYKEAFNSNKTCFYKQLSAKEVEWKFKGEDGKMILVLSENAMTKADLLKVSGEV